ncbi:MAG: hypothetical protein ACT4P1_00555 [Sporichthyaceae bacterium]
MIEKMLALHDGLRAAGIPHAFGGALALNFCIRQPRTTADIDLNIFVPVGRIEETLAALPVEVAWTEIELRMLRRDGQARLAWDETPVDLFFSVDDFHVEVGARIREQQVGGRLLPFLACEDLAVFKAFFNRPKDWIDLGNMADARTIDPAALEAQIADYLGDDDARLEKIRGLPVYPRS